MKKTHENGRSLRTVYRILSAAVCLAVIAVLVTVVSWMPRFGDDHNPADNEVYERYVEETAIPVDDGRMILCIMHDVTAEEEQRQRKDEISRETVEVADRVVEKQMRIAQEIASLLGETTAETKIALSKLKESISNE